MNTYREQLRAVLDVIHVSELNEFTWFGVSRLSSDSGSDVALEPDQRLALLALALGEHLYRHFFCCGRPVPHAGEWGGTPTSIEAQSFASLLVQANCGGGPLDRSWLVDEFDSTNARLSKHNLTILVRSRDCILESGQVLAEGEYVSIRLNSGSFQRSPGYYLAFGDATPNGDSDAQLVRVYWNVTPDGAQRLVRSLTSELNGVGLPFQLKVLNDARNYGRSDSAVLYIERRTYEQFRTDHAPRIRQHLSGVLCDPIPALTKPVSFGVSIAEEPAGHNSFGFDRCAALARAVVQTLGADLTIDEKLELVETEFRRSGIDPDRPYLNLGSTDDLRPFKSERFRSRSWSTRPEQHVPIRSGDEFTQVARVIGGVLSESAIWHHDQCTWVGSLGPVSERSSVPRFGSIGGNLYDGTAGVALFLGELFGITEDKLVRRTALGAIEHALRFSSQAQVSPLGFYTGTLGIATVAARLGVLLDSDNLRTRARDIAVEFPQECSDFDLTSGLAGNIIGYLVLHDLIGGDDLIQLALAAGNQLIGAALESDLGSSWGSTHLPGRRNLTGLSHGASGHAYALTALFAATGDDGAKRTAKAAMDYERAWFDSTSQNWPDFRDVTDRPDLGAFPLPFGMTWCHGAPGIALSRLLAAETFLLEPVYAEEASVAARTTCDHLIQWVQTGRGNYSLCHGIAGNADILLTATRSAAVDNVDPDDVVRMAASLGLQTYHRSGFWPCGIGGGKPAPGLMVGLAGIGHFYLRLGNPSVPSILAPFGTRTDCAS